MDFCIPVDHTQLRINVHPRRAGVMFGGYQPQRPTLFINLMLDLDGTGRAEIETGVGFLDHMKAKTHKLREQDSL